MTMTATRVRARVEGEVQGVGFRPFVYRLAGDLGLSGWVLNDERGVVAEVGGEGGGCSRRGGGWGEGGRAGRRGGRPPPHPPPPPPRRWPPWRGSSPRTCSPR